MSDKASAPTLIYERPTAWIADATIDDTRAFAERVHRTWGDIFSREEKRSDAEHLTPGFAHKS